MSRFHSFVPFSSGLTVSVFTVDCLTVIVPSLSRLAVSFFTVGCLTVNCVTVIMPHSSRLAMSVFFTVD